MLSYLGLLANETMDYQVQAGWTPFEVIQLVDSSLALELTSSAGKTTAVLTWKPPNYSKSKTYLYRVFVAKHSKKVNNNWCNMQTVISNSKFC
jgi:hypothetical protein